MKYLHSCWYCIGLTLIIIAKPSPYNKCKSSHFVDIMCSLAMCSSHDRTSVTTKLFGCFVLSSVTKKSGVWNWHPIDLYVTSIAQRSGDENITWCDTAIVFAFCYQLLTQLLEHYDDVIMSTLASQITSLTIVYSTIYSGADQSKHQSSASLAFVWGIHRGPVKSPHKWPVTRKMFPFDDVIMEPIYDDLLF